MLSYKLYVLKKKVKSMKVRPVGVYLQEKTFPRIVECLQTKTGL